MMTPPRDAHHTPCSRSRFLALALTALGLACIDNDDAVRPPAERADDAPEVESGRGGLTEAPHMLALARAIPGFAGLYFEGDRLVIAMAETDAADFGVARRSVSALFAEHGRPQPADDFVERVVEYSFIDLARHRARLDSKLFEIDGVETHAIDQVSNRIEIGVSDPSAREAVLDLATESDVPVEMLSFERMGSVRPWVGSVEDLPTAGREAGIVTPTLRDPAPDSILRGGYQVVAEGKLPCTAGFVANGYYVVTASHCSAVEFQKDTFSWGQPAIPDYHVGRESKDPGPKKDRWADATQIEIDTTSFVYRKITRSNGSLARPTHRHIPIPGQEGKPGPNIITIADAKPIVIKGRADFITPGESVDKIGIASGWTSGLVDDLCAKSKRLLPKSDGGDACLVSAKIYGTYGDSGGPVFRYDPTGAEGLGTARLAGSVVGGKYDENGVYLGIAFFSPLYEIETDLGPLQVGPCLWIPGSPLVPLPRPQPVCFF